MRLIFTIVGVMLVQGCLESPAPILFPDGPKSADAFLVPMPTDGLDRAQAVPEGRVPDGPRGMIANTDMSPMAAPSIDATVPLDSAVNVSPDSGWPSLCFNGSRDNGETDVDCGGPDCPPCADTDRCRVASDCESMVCRFRRCRAARCGDGVINGNEDCDDGNLSNDDGCPNDCTRASCGNGIVDEGEGSCDCPDRTANTDNDPSNGCECNVLSNKDTTCDGIDDDCDGKLDEDFKVMVAEQTPCMSEMDSCDPTGTRTETRIECINGTAADIEYSGVPCMANTDGKLINEVLGPCLRSVQTPCGPGVQEQTRTVCQNGAPDAVVDSVPCDIVTMEGEIIDIGAWSECGSFEGECGEEGTQTRSVTQCQTIDGQLVDQTQEESRACQRLTDGLVVSSSPFGECQYIGACYVDGAKTRVQSVCQAGQVSDGQFDTAACEREVNFAECRCVIDPGNSGIDINGTCQPRIPVVANTIPAGLVTIRCVESETSCIAADRPCALQCLPGDQMVICCSNGGACIGNDQLRPDASFNKVEVELSGFKESERCDSDARQVDCTPTLATDVPRASVTCRLAND